MAMAYILDVEFIPYLLIMRAIVFAGTFFLQISIKLFSRRKFCLLKFVSTVEIFVAVNVFLKDEITA